MRLKPEIKKYTQDTSSILFPDAEVYLFGSRTNEKSRGGDIDLLILSDSKIEKSKIRNFRIGFIKKYGWQKLDLVNFTKDDNSTFKQIILKEAQHLSNE